MNDAECETGMKAYNDFDEVSTNKGIDAIKPHLKNVYKQARKDAIAEHRDSKEYKDFLEAFVDTEDYTRLLENKATNLENLSAYLDHIEVLLKMRMNKYDKAQLNHEAFELLRSYAIRETFSVTGNFDNLEPWQENGGPLGEATLETWKEIATEAFTASIDEDIECSQKHWADRKIKLITSNWFSYNDEKEFDALIATLSITSLDKMEEAVRNSLDYKALTIEQ